MTSSLQLNLLNCGHTRVATEPNLLGILIDPELDRAILVSGSIRCPRSTPAGTSVRCGLLPGPELNPSMLSSGAGPGCCCRIYCPPGPTVFASSSTHSLIVASFSNADEAMTLRSGWHATPTTTSQCPSPGESGPGRPSSTCTSCAVQRVRSGVSGCVKSVSLQTAFTKSKGVEACAEVALGCEARRPCYGDGLVVR